MTLEEARSRMDATRLLRLDCALKLHKEAGAVLGVLRQKPRTEEDAVDALCLAGALAECYVVTLRWMAAIGNPAVDGLPLSERDEAFKEAVAAWGRQYDWLVRQGIRRAFVHDNGVRKEALPFSTLHEMVMAAYRKVRAFRREVKEEG